MTFKQLTEEHLDALREISNVGMGHAATALSQMVGETIYLHVPRVTVADIVEVPDLMGGPEQVVVGITLQVRGDACGNILLVFPMESAKRMVSRLLGQAPVDGVFDEIGISTIKEVGNILASAYLGAMGSLLNLSLIPSIPLFANDMAGSIIDFLLIELSEEGNQALMIETEFHGNGLEEQIIRGHFFLMPDPTSLEVITTAVGGVNDRA
ncbi:MAG: CheY-P-specific phosphatase CheC [Desulfuromonas sp.]|nr:MAG: CheY-P-specific phosphatase CheC [Desulfuromonas sp.]